MNLKPKMYLKPTATEHIESLLKLLGALNIKSAQKILANRYGGMGQGLAALKELYKSDKFDALVYSSNPFLKLISKDDQIKGSFIPLPLIYKEDNDGND